MLCQNCHMNEATTHIRTIVNGETASVHLCADCARSLGYGDMFADLSSPLAGLFGSFLAADPIRSLSDSVIRCDKCGSTFDDIVSTGRVGCPDCYRVFYDRLLPAINKLHGSAGYRGKKPRGAVSEAPASDTKRDSAETAALREELTRAVNAQDFERAAVLRDEIKRREEQDDG